MKLTLLKKLVVLQALFQGLGLLLGAETWHTASVYLGGSLGIYFFSREAINDERVDQLKLKAIRLGFYLGLLTALWMNLFGNLSLLSGVIPTISAIDTLGLILLVAVVAFHYWRWQDGRANASQGQILRIVTGLAG